MRLRSAAVAAITISGLLLGAGTSWAASTKTELSNGTLYYEALDGSEVTGNSTLFYGATKYKKTGGSKVTVQLGQETVEGSWCSGNKSVSAGQTVSHSFGGQSKAKYAYNCKATGKMKASNGGPWYTPTVHFC